MGCSVWFEEEGEEEEEVVDGVRLGEELESCVLESAVGGGEKMERAEREDGAWVGY